MYQLNESELQWMVQTIPPEALGYIWEQVTKRYDPKKDSLKNFTWKLFRNREYRQFISTHPFPVYRNKYRPEVASRKEKVYAKPTPERILDLPHVYLSNELRAKVLGFVPIVHLGTKTWKGRCALDREKKELRELLGPYKKR